MAHSLLLTLSGEGLTLLAPIFEGSLEGLALLAPIFEGSLEGFTLLAPIFEGSLEGFTLLAPIFEGPPLLQPQPRPKPLPFLHPKIVIPIPQSGTRLFLRAAFWCVGPRTCHPDRSEPASSCMRFLHAGSRSGGIASPPSLISALPLGLPL